MFNDVVLTVLIAAVLLALVLIYLAFSQRNLKANVQRIKDEFQEEFAKPVGQVVTLPPGVEAPPEEPLLQELPRDAAAQLDARIAQATQLLRAADERIARLETAIARAERLASALNPSSDQPTDR